MSDVLRCVGVEVVGGLEQLAYKTFWEAVSARIHDKVVKGDRHPERFAREPTGAGKEYDRSSSDIAQELAEGRFVNHKISMRRRRILTGTPCTFQRADLRPLSQRRQTFRVQETGLNEPNIIEDRG